MLSRSRLAAISVVVVALSAMPAAADLVEQTTVQESGGEVRHVCADRFDSTQEGDTWTAVCAMLVDDDGDGGWERARVGVGRQTCTNGPVTTCDDEEALEYVDPAGVAIDAGAGWATVHTTVQGCAVDVELAASDAPSTERAETERAVVGLDPAELRVITARRAEEEASDSSVSGTGSVCDWLTGAELFGSISTGRRHQEADGLDVHPGEAPVVGAGVEHGERESRSSSDQACAYYYDDGRDVEVCGLRIDDGDDGTVDRVEIHAYQFACDPACEVDAEVLTGLDDGAVAIDVDKGTARLHVDGGDCPIHLELVPDAWYAYDGSSRRSTGFDARRATALEVGLGGTATSSWYGQTSIPRVGAVVCDWDVDTGLARYGDVGHGEETTRERYVAARPERLVP